ncbi:MAG: hypothetical protein HY718_07195 [Planctomycetes bacterium]|nr:hypothetical protein [Planctomycetota bacterium]
MTERGWRTEGAAIPRVMAILGACVALGSVSPAAAVHLRGQIVRTGYPGSGTGQLNGDIYRLGRYAPVLVELTNDDGDQFEGTITVHQTDGDGDEVVASQEVAVRGLRRFHLYVPGGPLKEGSFVRGMGYDGPAPFLVRVFDRQDRLARLYDDKGDPVKELMPPRQVLLAPTGALMILDISQRPVNQLDRLTKLQNLQDHAVMRCSPKDLPDSVAGLEMADVIIWDGANPTALDTLQNEAILEWVRRGGRLIIGVSKNWNALTTSPFGPLLPGRLSGTQGTSDETILKPLLPDREGAVTARTARRTRSLTYCPLTRVSLAADAVAVLPPSRTEDHQIWIARRNCGRGEVTLVTAELQELLGLRPDDDDRLMRTTLLRMNIVPESDDTNRWGMRPIHDLFSDVAARTAFQQTSGLYFAFAFAFVIGYIVIVTGGTWGWLRRHRAVRHAWVASALVAAAASGVSLGAVQLVRAFGQGVHEMTVVDGRAGSFEATATSYLGLKTASHTLLDLCVPRKWLDPGDSIEVRGSLRPMVAEARPADGSTFSAPARYEAVAQLGELRSVPLRATLKQFEATWRGEIPGRLVASLRRRAEPARDELDSSSWVDNQLATDLENCYVFTRASDLSAVRVYVIPKLAAGEKVSWSAITRFMEERDKAKKQSLGGRLRSRVENATEGDAEPAWSPPLLQHLMAQCLFAVSSVDPRTKEEADRQQNVLAANVGRHVPALLLLTFYRDAPLTNLLVDGRELSRSQGEELEMWSCLDGNTALFVGFSEQPSPLRLCRRKPGGDVDDWKPLKPSQSVVMYRFTVPVQ